MWVHVCVCVLGFLCACGGHVFEHASVPCGCVRPLILSWIQAENDLGEVAVYAMVRGLRAVLGKMMDSGGLWVIQY